MNGFKYQNSQVIKKYNLEFPISPAFFPLKPAILWPHGKSAQFADPAVKKTLISTQISKLLPLTIQLHMEENLWQQQAMQKITYYVLHVTVGSSISLRVLENWITCELQRWESTRTATRHHCVPG